MDETLDPRSGSPGNGTERPIAMAVIHVLFHADLRRIEEVHVLGPEGRDSAPVAIGRDQPLFVAPANRKQRALNDPCISRHQFTVRYLASPARFEVAVSPQARRAVRFLTEAGVSI